MIKIKDQMPESDNVYLIYCPDYESKPFKAYLDDNGDWHDARLPKSGLAFVFYEVLEWDYIKDENEYL